METMVTTKITKQGPMHPSPTMKLSYSKTKANGRRTRPGRPTLASLNPERAATAAASLTCTQCGKVYADRSGLHRHMRVHADEWHYRCDNCNISYYRADQLRKHKMTCNPPVAPLDLAAVSTSTAPSSNNPNGINTRSKYRPVVEKEAPVEQPPTSVASGGAVRRVPKSLKKLGAYVMSPVVPPLIPPPPADAVSPDSSSAAGLPPRRLSSCLEPATCEVCGKTYSNRSNMRAHQRTAHKDVANVQPPAALQPEGMVVRPVMAVHKASTRVRKVPLKLRQVQEAAPVRKKKKFACPQCDASYNHSASLYRHAKKHREAVGNAGDVRAGQAEIVIKRTKRQVHPTASSALSKRLKKSVTFDENVNTWTYVEGNSDSETEETEESKPIMLDKATQWEWQVADKATQISLPMEEPYDADVELTFTSDGDDDDDSV